jgi:Xaa-Pro aminopeptidase
MYSGGPAVGSRRQSDAIPQETLVPRRLSARALVVALALAASALAAALPAHAQIAESEYAARRAALASRIGDGALVAFGAGEPAHDYMRFDQAPSFLYLTGVREPGAALVMTRRGGRTSVTLFVEPNDPAREVWTGSRAGVEGTARRTGVAVRPASQLRAVLDSVAGSVGQLYVVGELRGDHGGAVSRDQAIADALGRAHPRLRVTNANGLVERLRARKSPAELALIRKAVEITADAQREAMAFIEPGVNEFEVQALIEYTFRRNGADRPSFATIVASGPNSTALHYNADDRFMEAGDVVVMDVGASYRGYAADVTRTVPVGGSFTPAQREIYQLVRDAQAAAERQARPGAAASLMTDSSTAVLAAGLARLGLIEAPDATYDCGQGAGGAQQCPQYQLYYMHGLGHGIGLEVHDPEQYYATGRIDEGSAFTIEPGVYVRGNLLDILPRTARNAALAAKIRPAVERFRDVGVRIEDDYVVTDRGVEWISRVPRELDEVEAMMRQPFAGPAKRDTTKVEWYRQTQ